MCQFLAGQVDLEAHFQFLKDDHSLGATPHAGREIEHIKVRTDGVHVQGRTDCAADLVHRVTDDAALVHEELAAMLGAGERQIVTAEGLRGLMRDGDGRINPGTDRCGPEARHNHTGSRPIPAAPCFSRHRPTPKIGSTCRSHPHGQLKAHAECCWITQRGALAP